MTTIEKSKKVKNYSPEFKAQALETLANSPKSMRVLAKDLGISYQTMMTWKKLKSLKEPVKNDETKKLKQENEILRKENEILKKAAAFFAKQLN